MSGSRVERQAQAICDNGMPVRTPSSAEVRALLPLSVSVRNRPLCAAH